MDQLKLLFDAIVGYFHIQFTIFGYTFSFWTVLIYGLIASFVCVLLGFCVKAVFWE